MLASSAPPASETTRAVTSGDMPSPTTWTAAAQQIAAATSWRSDQTRRKMDSAYLSAIAELENGGDEIHGYSGEKLKDVVVIRDVDFAHEESEVECGREYDEEAENYFLTVHAMPRFAGYPTGEGGRKNRPNDLQAACVLSARMCTNLQFRAIALLGTLGLGDAAVPPTPGRRRSPSLKKKKRAVPM